MARVRFKDGGLGSFHGNLAYKQAVSKEHFLRKLDEVVEWPRFTKKLIKYYRGRGEVGQAPYDPVLILKMLLLSYLFSISERQVEELVNDSLSAKCFSGHLGFRRHGVQSYLTFMALNLKRLVKLLTGVGLRGESKLSLAV